MKRAVFEIKQNAVGSYYFIFKDKAGNGLIVSRSFADRARLEICIALIRDMAKVAGIFEDIEEGADKAPLFLIEKNESDYSFSLIGFIGEVVFSSQSYAHKEECIKNIKLLKNLSLDAGIVDSV